MKSIQDHLCEEYVGKKLVWVPGVSSNHPSLGGEITNIYFEVDEDHEPGAIAVIETDHNQTVSVYPDEEIDVS